MFLICLYLILFSYDFNCYGTVVHIFQAHCDTVYMTLHVYIASLGVWRFFVSVLLICLCTCICMCWGMWRGGCAFVCLYVYDMCMGPYGSPLACGHQRTTSWSWFSPSAFMWVSSIKYSLPRLAWQAPLPRANHWPIFLCLERGTAASIIQGVTSAPPSPVGRAATWPLSKSFAFVCCRFPACQMEWIIMSVPSYTVRKLASTLITQDSLMPDNLLRFIELTGSCVFMFTVCFRARL